MSEPTPGTAPVQPQTEPGAAAPQQPQATTPAPGTTPAQAQPSVEELQAKLAEITKAKEVAENTAKHFQSQFDKVRTQAAAIAQPEPPKADPLAPIIAKLTAKGMLPEDARAIAESQYELIQPLQQELQQARQSLQSTTQVDAAINAAYQQDNDLFRDPRVVDYVRAELQAAAVSAQGHQFVNPQYATACAQAEWARLNTPWKQQTLPPGNPPPPPPQNGVRPLNFAGPQPGYTPAAQPAAKPENPLAAPLAAQMAAYTGIPLSQQ